MMKVYTVQVQIQERRYMETGRVAEVPQSYVAIIESWNHSCLRRRLAVTYVSLLGTGTRYHSSK